MVDAAHSAGIRFPTPPTTWCPRKDRTFARWRSALRA
jgi:hypothetical protein